MNIIVSGGSRAAHSAYLVDKPPENRMYTFSFSSVKRHPSLWSEHCLIRRTTSVLVERKGTRPRHSFACEELQATATNKISRLASIRIFIGSISKHPTPSFSCGARKNSSWKAQDYLRNMLSSRQLQALVIWRGDEHSAKAPTAARKRQA
jgi:hypothetical protein